MTTDAKRLAEIKERVATAWTIGDCEWLIALVERQQQELADEQMQHQGWQKRAEGAEAALDAEKQELASQGATYEATVAGARQAARIDRKWAERAEAALDAFTIAASNQSAPTAPEPSSQKCRECSGTGRAEVTLPLYLEDCRACGGTGVEDKRKEAADA